MGLFDYVRCEYPLPLEGANALEYQTKDTDWPYMERYEIRADGTLWRQFYDVEDHSDKNAEPGSAASIAGCMARVNERWSPESLSGAFEFYTSRGDEWIEFAALFDKGKLLSIMHKTE